MVFTLTPLTEKSHPRAEAPVEYETTGSIPSREEKDPSLTFTWI